MNKIVLPQERSANWYWLGQKEYNSIEVFKKIKHFVYINHIKPNAPLKKEISFCKKNPKTLVKKSAQKAFQSL